MYNLAVVTPAASPPVSVADLRTHLRLNDTAEDTQLTEFLAAAVVQFEDECRRPIMPTRYRQTFAAWPTPAIVFGRGNVKTVHELRRFTDLVGTTEVLSSAYWYASLSLYPQRVILRKTPDPLAEADAVGYVEFTAGWVDANDVPPEVKVGLKLLAAHWYANREAFKDSAFEMRQLPQGWGALTAKYKLHLQGDWGQA